MKPEPKEAVKRGSHPELYIMLNAGISPLILVEKFNYSKGTVYSYNKKLKVALKKVEEIFESTYANQPIKKPIQKKSSSHTYEKSAK